MSEHCPPAISTLKPVRYPRRLRKIIMLGICISSIVKAVLLFVFTPFNYHQAIMSTYNRIVLAERPETDIDDKTFKMETAPMPDKESLKDDQVIVKVEHLSLDPGRHSHQFYLFDARADLLCNLQPCVGGYVMQGHTYHLSRLEKSCVQAD